MSSNAFNYLALLAALVVGYGIFVSSSDPESAAHSATGDLQGYYLRDAVITETTASGSPHFRIAAAEVAQNLKENSFALTGLRVDYLKSEDAKDANAQGQLPGGAQGPTPGDAPPGDAPPGDAHWVLNSDRGTAFDNFRKLALRGNVQAHNLGAAREVVLDAPSLDIDINKETASSKDRVQIGIDKSTVSGDGLFVDLRRERFTLDSNVGLRFAQLQVPATEPSVQIPESFDAKSVAYDENKILTMTDVVSKSPPFVKARELKASGRDIANNKIEMRGNVSIELPKSGALTADTAIVTLRDRRVAQAHVTADVPGKLVEFQHRAKDNGKIIRGRAAVIDYDVEQASLKLRGNVWFQDEGGEWEFEELDYNITTEAFNGKELKATLKRRPKPSATTTTDNP